MWTLVHLDIEELTHKTGNFKQFDIFVNMLENAITEVSTCNTKTCFNFLRALLQCISFCESFVFACKYETVPFEYYILLRHLQSQAISKTPLFFDVFQV